MIFSESSTVRKSCFSSTLLLSISTVLEDSQNMSNTQDIIKPIDVLRKAPALLKKLPKMVYGLAIGSSTNPTKTGGLGWH